MLCKAISCYFGISTQYVKRYITLVNYNFHSLGIMLGCAERRQNKRFLAD